MAFESLLHGHHSEKQESYITRLSPSMVTVASYQGTGVTVAYTWRHGD